MTDEQDPNELDPPIGQAQPCIPCRGSGKVISHLGGETSTIDCPWCLGSGTRPLGMDAQAAWIDKAEQESNDNDDPAAEDSDDPETDEN